MTLVFQGIAWLLLEPRSPYLYAVKRFPSGRSPNSCFNWAKLTIWCSSPALETPLYQTAARAQLLEIFVDVEHTRERLLRCLCGEEKESVDPGKKLLDDGFMALERAQKSNSREAAIELYKEAERSFWEAEKLLNDDRSRELLRTRRGDLQRTIRALEKEVAVSLVPIATPPIAPVVPEVTTAPPVVDISARLEELRRFAAHQESAKHQTQQGKQMDLTARLAALKNEKAGPAQPVDELAVRLRRLKGDSAVAGDASLEGKSAVDRIIEQVTDEIALGIEDEEIEGKGSDTLVVLRRAMEYAVRLDGERLVDEEEFQQHTETAPSLSGSVATRLFPKSLHQLLQELKEDRLARDTLRKLSATSVSPAISQLAQAWMQLIINTDTALPTSFEQDERLVLNIRDSMLRLREIEDNRDQVAFELAQAREAYTNMSEKLTTQSSRLEAQLRDTKRAADDILGPTERDREEHLQAALSSFETQNSNAQEQVETLQRTIPRVTQTSQQAEIGERKHTQHTATELRELIERYDMDRLDVEIEQEKANSLV
eukprot:jgi/Phyca11/13415/fgenesh1_pg.PHYCAscaffold_3_\